MHDVEVVAQSEVLVHDLNAHGIGMLRVGYVRRRAFEVDLS